jgi:hypothetical protein
MKLTCHAVQALQDYDYMKKRSRIANDPFYISGESWLHRGLLDHHLKRPSQNGRRVELEVKPIGVWETRGTDPRAVTDSRWHNFRRTWRVGFYQRLGGATLGAAFLIAPMWIMVFRNTLWAALASTTAFVAAFGLLSAVFLTTVVEVLSSTAGYAAVLVVFAGLITEKERFPAS